MIRRSVETGGRGPGDLGRPSLAGYVIAAVKLRDRAAQPLPGFTRGSREDRGGAAAQRGRFAPGVLCSWSLSSSVVRPRAPEHRSLASRTRSPLSEERTLALFKSAYNTPDPSPQKAVPKGLGGGAELSVPQARVHCRGMSTGVTPDGFTLLGGLMPLALENIYPLGCPTPCMHWGCPTSSIYWGCPTSISTGVPNI